MFKAYRELQLIRKIAANKRKSYTSPILLKFNLKEISFYSAKPYFCGFVHI